MLILIWDFFVIFMFMCMHLYTCVCPDIPLTNVHHPRTKYFHFMSSLGGNDKVQATMKKMYFGSQNKNSFIYLEQCGFQYIKWNSQTMLKIYHDIIMWGKKYSQVDIVLVVNQVHKIHFNEQLLSVPKIAVPYLTNYVHTHFCKHTL